MSTPFQPQPADTDAATGPSRSTSDRPRRLTESSAASALDEPNPADGDAEGAPAPRAFPAAHAPRQIVVKHALSITRLRHPLVIGRVTRSASREASAPVPHRRVADARFVWWAELRMRATSEVASPSLGSQPSLRWTTSSGPRSTAARAPRTSRALAGSRPPRTPDRSKQRLRGANSAESRRRAQHARPPRPTRLPALPGSSNILPRLARNFLTR